MKKTSQRPAPDRELVEIAKYVCRDDVGDAGAYLHARVVRGWRGDKAAWLNWDLSSVPDKTTRAMGLLSEAYHVTFTPATSTTPPRLSAYETKADADACSAGTLP
mgnify:CR=1 FL=1